MTYRVDVIVDDSGHSVGDDLIFATREEAEAHIENRVRHWAGVRQCRVVVDEEV